nr:ribonuclease H-like domain-containing protein [Tanacetum cinerariifolium]
MVNVVSILTILFLVQGNPQHALKDKGVIDSGCSRHMTGNISYLSDFEKLNGGYMLPLVVIQRMVRSLEKMCDKKNNVLFTNTECLVLSPEFKLPDENQVLLKVHRENNRYNVDLKNIVPSGDLTFRFAKATLDESTLWHRRLGHINFKTMNKLVKDITYSDDEKDVGVEVDFTNLETTITVNPIPTNRVHKDHPVTQIIGDLSSATQTRSMTWMAKDKEPKRVHQAFKDPSWIEAIQDELLQFKMQKVWVLVDLPHGKRAIGLEDPNYSNKVYKVVKALYGLHQAPRA